VSILKPRELGGITAYNMNTGDKAWWSSNGGRMTQPAPNPNSPDAALFANVKLPMQGANLSQQPQVINTKTLVIYGTGRRGGGANVPPQLHAVDKATGKQVGAVTLPSPTSAVPMTFMHNGKQYVVVASGGAVIALALPDGR
jgi:glucose dehydrogenase